MRFFFFFCALRAILHVEATYALWEEDGKKKNEVVDGMQKRNRAKLHTSARIAQISFYLFKHWVYVWSLFFFFYFVSLLASVSHRYFFFFPLRFSFTRYRGWHQKLFSIFSVLLSFFFFFFRSEERASSCFFFSERGAILPCWGELKTTVKKERGKKKRTSTATEKKATTFSCARWKKWRGKQ